MNATISPTQLLIYRNSGLHLPPVKLQSRFLLAHHSTGRSPSRCKFFQQSMAFPMALLSTARASVEHGFLRSSPVIQQMPK